MTWEQFAATVSLGQLVGSDGWVYRFSADDLRWGARLVIGEVESSATTEEAWWILWSVANSMYLRRDPRATYATTAHGYSVALHGSATEVPRRGRIQSLEPSDIPAGAMDRILRFFRGEVQAGSVVGIVLSDQCSTADPSLGPADLRSPSDECYWRVPETRAWNASTLVAQPAGPPRIVAPVSPRRAGIGLLVALLLVGAAVGLLWRR